MLSIKKKLLRTKYALSHTVQKILEINKKRKNLSFFLNKTKKEEALQDDLELLNKLADKQARLIERYEQSIQENERGPEDETLLPQVALEPA